MVNFTAPVAPLFVPASRPEKFAKADASGTDAVILDLEDAVAASDKERARDLVVAHAAELKCPIMIRINAAGTPWHDADIDAVRRIPDISIMLPKAERAADIVSLVDRIGRDLPVVALVESAAGLAGLPEILTAPGVVALAFGSVDFSLDVGCADDRFSLLAVRSEIVWRSRAANRSAPIDGVTTDLTSYEPSEDDARHARKLGFGGKMAIHPKQIEPISRAFRPSEKEIDWARNVIVGAASGEAVQVNGEMVDRPVIERARRTLKRAGLALTPY